jgi:hypothetical protein
MAFLKRVFRALGKWANAAGPEDLSDRELADLGLSRTDMRILMSGSPGAELRVQAMAQQLGIGPDELAARPNLAYELTATCGQCVISGPCMRAAKDGRRLPIGNCPNAGNFAAFAAA